MPSDFRQRQVNLTLADSPTSTCTDSPLGFALSEEQALIQESVRELAQKSSRPKRLK